MSRLLIASIILLAVIGATVAGLGQLSVEKPMTRVEKVVPLASLQK